MTNEKVWLIILLVMMSLAAVSMPFVNCLLAKG